jgi:hypothetical protein
MTRPPHPSLQAQAEDRANQDHNRRMAEIKAMAPLLARLDAFVPALHDRGLEVYVSNLQLHTEYMNDRRVKVLRIDTCGMLDSRRPARYLETLLAAGFVEEHRSEGVMPQAILRHGHLRVKVDVPSTTAQRAAQAAAYACRAAAELAAEDNATVAA